MGYRVAIFDFDGTVADTGRGVKNSVKYALSEFGIPVGDESALDYFIGPPLYEGFEHVYGVSKELATELVEAYRVYYSKTGLFEIDPYTGILETIAALRESGIKLAVASSKPKHFLDTAVEYIGAKPLFDFVCGPELNNHDSNKSSLILKTLKALDASADSNAVMIGDRFYDVEGANNVGIDSIGVTFGYGTYEELKNANATHIVDTVTELKTLILD